MIKATCHCKKVSWQIEHLPESVTTCNCSICYRLGVLWAYYHQDQVKLDYSAEALESYSWGQKKFTFYRCKNCGITTHYHKPSAEKIAVNARLLAEKQLSGVRVRHFDGADQWKYLDDPGT